jgi:lipoteichoic acid synthase
VNGLGKIVLWGALLIWAKTYGVQRFAFELPVEGAYQEFILWMNPISSTLCMILMGMLILRRRPRLAILLVSFFSSLILLINLIYYRCFNDFITLPVLMELSNLGDLGNSILNLVKVTDLFVFADTLFLAIGLYIKKYRVQPLSRVQLLTLCQLSAVLFAMNLFMAETVRPDLLSRTFDREIVIKNIGAFNYFAYDAVINLRLESLKAFNGHHHLAMAKSYQQKLEHDQKNPAMFGIAKGRNVFLISMESLQSFVIQQSSQSKEITPFLNQLIKESFYFDNFYHQTGQGKTSDAEFIIDTSLYPLPSGAVFFTHPKNTYQTLPKTLRERGYYTAVFHANHKTFWNRNLMYPALGYERFFSAPDFQINADNSVGWGLKDIPFFEQSVGKIKALPKPFFCKLITLTNHYPFTLDDKDRMMPELASKSGTLNRYIPSVRYMDEALKLFFDQIKAAGVYSNSIFILYGDHNGISQKHDKAMAGFLGKKKITPFDHIQLQRVPLLIHIPGMAGQTRHSLGGQIDLKPTIFHLLGIEAEHDVHLGQDLFALNKREFTVLRNGSFITDTRVYTRNKCYDRATGNKIDAASCEPWKDKAASALGYSDNIIFGDLLRTIAR